MDVTCEWNGHPTCLNPEQAYVRFVEINYDQFFQKVDFKEHRRIA